MSICGFITSTTGLITGLGGPATGRSAGCEATDEDTSSRSWRTRQQLRQSDQIEGGTREHEEPVDLGQAAQLDLTHPGDGLQPSERRFDPWPRMLTLRVAVMTGGAGIEGTAPRSGEVLRDVGCRPELAHQGHKIGRVVALVGADGAAALRGALPLLVHQQRRR